MYTPLQSTKLYEQVVDQIRRQIISSSLKDGDQLPNERTLAEQFRVSRTVVREAIKTLAKEGLVEVRHGRGTFVIDGTSQALRRSLDLMISIGQVGGITDNDMVEIRQILEPGIAALAATRATEQDIADLREAVAIMDANMDNVSVYISADSNFHLTLAKATYNALISIILDPIVDLLHRQRERIFHVVDGPARGQYHHKRILDAIVGRDPERAREAMRAHMKQVREFTMSPNSGDTKND
jgi:GntR family transcriptional repressor for pyruvate dehydrogenase complex